jgi:predicted MFS family arabinose efflux permease
VFGFSNAETDSWGSGWTWGPIIVAAVLLVAFFAWQRRTAHPLLPLGVLLDRNRGAAFASVLIAGAGMFAIFLFVTYYTQSTLGYTPIQTGLAFLPMIGGLVLAAQIGTNVLLPRFGPKVLVPIGMLLVASAMVLFTRLDVHSSYAGALLPALIVMGLGMGTVMPGSMQSATLGVDRSSAGVASALVNTSQQVGGSIGTALLNTLAATTAATFAANHLAEGKAVVADAAVHGYAIAYWLDAALFVFGALLAAIMFRRRTPAPRTDAVASPQVSAEPVLAH